LRSIKIDKARKAPGVIAVYTGADLAAAKVGGLPCGWLITDVKGQPMKEPPYPPLAQGKVRHVGERVAVVIAETAAQARDAAELIEVDYQPLPPSSAPPSEERPGAARGRARQHMLCLGHRRQERGRCGVCQGCARHQARPREQPLYPTPSSRAPRMPLFARR